GSNSAARRKAVSGSQLALDGMCLGSKTFRDFIRLDFQFRNGIVSHRDRGHSLIAFARRFCVFASLTANGAKAKSRCNLSLNFPSEFSRRFVTAKMGPPKVRPNLPDGLLPSPAQGGTHDSQSQLVHTSHPVPANTAFSFG